MCFIPAFSQSADETYKQEIDQWHVKRENRLKSETGWLTVSGLFWLSEGDNTVGADPSNLIHFPKNKCDAFLGNFQLKAGNVYFTSKAENQVKKDSSFFNSGLIFGDGMEEGMVVLAHKNLRFFIIKRGERIGIRLRDLDSEARKHFTSIERFPVDRKWCVKARFEPAKEKKTIPILDVIGQTTETPFAGTLYFELDGKKLQLDATLEGTELFIVFSDYTAGNTTYGGGRFLYATVPAIGNEVVLDFNKAYNPPCAFTSFATCPLPPDQNKLAVEILAGEKSYGQH